MRRGDMLAPMIVGCAGFMQAFDGNAVAIALPAMTRVFHAPPLDLGTVITSYLVGAASFLPLCGWLAERCGARALFLAAIALFGLTSLLCGLTTSLVALDIARFAQGCAGAMLLPVGRIIVLAHVPRDQMLRAMGAMTTPVMLGPLLGPPIGGLIVTMASWRWLFFLNIPVAIVGAFLVLRCIPPIVAGAPRRLDVRGTVMLSAALAGLTYGVSLVTRPDMREAGLSLIAAGLIGAGAYAFHGRRHSEPVVPGHLFAIPSFAASNIGGLFPRLLVSAVPFLLTMLFQFGFHLSAAEAGGLVVASALGSLPARWIVGGLLDRWSFRGVLGVNAVLIALSVGVCAAFTAQTPHWLIMLVLTAQGLVRSTQLVAIMALGYSDVGAIDTPSASTIASLSQQIAMSLGVAIAIPAIEGGRLLAGNEGVTAEAVAPAFLLVALLSLLSLLWTQRLPGKASAVGEAALAAEYEGMA